MPTRPARSGSSPTTCPATTACPPGPLEDHPRIHHASIPVGACWLNLQEGWWRIFRKAALAGRSFANPDDIAYATTLATSQLNSRAKPWIWGRPTPPTR